MHVALLAADRSPKTKKPDRSSRISRANLAKPDQHPWWSGKKPRSGPHRPLQLPAKLNIFRTVLQQFICVDDRRRHVIHRQPFRHRLAANAFVSFGFAQALTIHQDRLGLLDSLQAGKLAFQFADSLLGFALLEPYAARDGEIGEQPERADRPLDDGDRAGLQHQLKRGRIFVADDGDQCWPWSVARLQKPLDIAADVVFDGQQHHVAIAGPAFRNRPLRLDHTADAAQMLDELDPLTVRRMNHLDAQASKIAKDLDRHCLLPRPEPQWLTV